MGLSIDAVKAIVLALSAASALAGVMAAKWVEDRRIALATGQALASGVLLAASVVHMMPDAEQILKPFANRLGTDFPLAHAVAGGVFVLLMLVEEMALGIMASASGAGRAPVKQPEMVDGVVTWQVPVTLEEGHSPENAEHHEDRMHVCCPPKQFRSAESSPKCDAAHTESEAGDHTHSEPEAEAEWSLPCRVHWGGLCAMAGRGVVQVFRGFGASLAAEKEVEKSCEAGTKAHLTQPLLPGMPQILEVKPHTHHHHPPSAEHSPHRHNHSHGGCHSESASGKPGHACISGEGMVALGRPGMSLTKAVCLYGALSFHSVMEGMGLGSAQQGRYVASISIAILAHKALESFALGNALRHSPGITGGRFMALAMLFAAGTPVGGVIGMVLSQTFEGSAVGFCSAIAAGTFLQVATMELIPGALHAEGAGGALCCATMAVGYGLFAMLALWC